MSAAYAVPAYAAADAPAVAAFVAAAADKSCGRTSIINMTASTWYKMHMALALALALQMSWVLGTSQRLLARASWILEIIYISTASADVLSSSRHADISPTMTYWWWSQQFTIVSITAKHVLYKSLKGLLVLGVTIGAAYGYTSNVRYNQVIPTTWLACTLCTFDLTKLKYSLATCCPMLSKHDHTTGAFCFSTGHP